MLRHTHPGLHPQRLKKQTLIALSWAIEDECCARAQRPLLFGAFQEARYYRSSAPRWRELARVAQILMSEFDEVTARATQPFTATLR